MPLRAQQKGCNIYAFEFNNESWSELKENSKNEHLDMPCCDARAIPKTSKLGNFFFAHHVRRECLSAPETQEHLYLKSLIAKAAKEAGWNVKTEWPGKTPDKERWVADVHCEKDGTIKVFEVQLSKLSSSQINNRQNKYSGSGIKTIWISTEKSFKNHTELSSIHLPLFLIEPSEINADPTVSDFNIPLSNFVTGTLQGKLHWRPIKKHSHLFFVEDKCSKCHRPINQICGGDGLALTACKGNAQRASDMLKEINSKFKTLELADYGLNYVAKTTVFDPQFQGYPYCNFCRSCHAPQDNKKLLTKLLDIVTFGKESVCYMAYPLTGEGYGKWVWKE